VFDELGTLHAQWKGAPAYVVGPKTGGRLRDLGFEVRGEESGNAKALVQRIAERNPSRPLLFLSGNRRRDEVPDGLRAEDIAFEEQVVYETHFRSDLALPPPKGSLWIVFFSPSGLKAVRRAEAGPLTGYRCAAIGPTTAGALRDQGLRVDAVADSPSPDGLVTAIEDASTDP
jgi:uroporphyrinogen-III synthase